MKHSLRSPFTGRFVACNQQVTPTEIVPGRLYGFKGTVVRARMKVNNGTWLVSFHKTLNGFVKPNELELIPKQRVNKYLKKAGIPV